MYFNMFKIMAWCTIERITIVARILYEWVHFLHNAVVESYIRTLASSPSVSSQIEFTLFAEPQELQQDAFGQASPRLKTASTIWSGDEID